MDLELQNVLERALARFVERNRKLGMENGTVLLVDYRTMEVRGYVGSAGHSNESIAGQVNGLRGKRSPGSALKPFIYALAIDEGLIQPQTVLKDTSLRISAYNPENFDRDFVGPIDATDALVRSRNVPAIELADRLELPGLYGFLKQAGVAQLREESFYGLALALGGVELTMEEVGELYAMLANGGIERPFVTRTDVQPESTSVTRLLSPEASFAVLEMLRTNPRPSEDSDSAPLTRGAAVPWKTGTSYGFRDAWAVGIVGPYVLGVWIGNFDGRPNPNFIGRDAAGPLFFSIVDALRARGPLFESIVHDRLNLRKVKVCALSGDLPRLHCDHLKETWFIPGKSPIRTCAVHREVRIDRMSGFRACPGDTEGTERQVFEFWPSDLLRLFRTSGIPRRVAPPSSPGCRSVVRGGVPPSISSPARGLNYTLHAEDRREIPFTAVTDADSRLVYWFVDNRLVGTSRPGEALFRKARPGNFIVRAVDDQGRSVAEDVTVTFSAHRAKRDEALIEMKRPLNRHPQCAAVTRPRLDWEGGAEEVSKMDPEVAAVRPRQREVDSHTFRAGFLAGVLAFVAFVGVFKDVYALIDPGRRGELAWGFLMVRYTSLERVWFGYRVTGDAAWYATFPHVAIYGAAIIGLAGLRRWGWWLVFLYVVYVSLSEWSFMFFYPLGHLTGEPYPPAWANEEWKFLEVSTPLELTMAALLWWYRDVFVR